MLRARLAGADALKREALRAVVAALPEILPWFRDRHDALMQFMELATDQFGGRPQNPGDLRALFEAAKAAPASGIAPAWDQRRMFGQKALVSGVIS